MRIGQVVALATVALIATACSAWQFTPPTTEICFPPTTPVPPTPAVVTSATPSGWAPVAYGNVQVSVPETYEAVYMASGPCRVVAEIKSGDEPSPDSSPQWDQGNSR